MKKLFIISVFILCTTHFASAKKNVDKAAEKYGPTLNIRAGLGYYGFAGHLMPMVMFNYEIDIARNFTLAPFVGLYSYSSQYYWGNNNYPYKHYNYRETAVPFGVKGTYYFDELFHANHKWDFYAAGSLGFELRTVTWENDYYGDKGLLHDGSPLYASGHVGVNYHIKPKVGIFLDASTGVSQFGVIFKL